MKRPMSTEKQTLIVPVLLIVVGTGWMLSTLGVVPNVDWVWTLGLAAVGLLTVALGGINKLTVVSAPMFLVASILSVLRQTGRLAFDVEVPAMVILLGTLMLVARSSWIPNVDFARRSLRCDETAPAR